MEKINMPVIHLHQPNQPILQDENYKRARKAGTREYVKKSHASKSYKKCKKFRKFCGKYHSNKLCVESITVTNCGHNVSICPQSRSS